MTNKTTMARWLAAGAVLVACGLLPARAQAPATSWNAVAERILARAMGASPIGENLRRLTDEVGGRVSGSPAMRRAVAWGVEAFRQAGVDEVHTEKFPLPLGWSEGETRLDVLAPMAFPVRLVSVGWAPPTPAGGIEAEVLDVGNGTAEDFARLGGGAKGKILLLHSELLKTWSDLFAEYERSPGIIDRAAAAGASALLWTSTREHGLLYRHQNTEYHLDKLPQAILAREDAGRMARFLAAGKNVRVRLQLPNRVTSGPVEEENVVAEIRGSEKPNEVVILGAHLDSWELGTGALDNGCDAALVVDAARAIRAEGLRPRRTLRFILFSGEEQGLHGSWQYVRAHRAELDNVVAVVIYDSGIGRVTGYSLGGRRDTEAALREVLKPVESWGSNNHTAGAETGTDHVDFLLEGVPTLVADMEEGNYIVNYHAASDTFDKVDLRELQLHTALAAVTVYGIADRPERIGRRLNRAEVEAMLRDTGLDKQLSPETMEMIRRGERGRQP
jgi:carboxypeptidase Q